MNRKQCFILLALTMLLCLVGCKGNKPATTTEATTTASTTESSFTQGTSGDDETYSADDVADKETDPTVHDKEEDKVEETTVPTVETETEGTTAPTLQEETESEETTAPTQPGETFTTYKAYMDMSADEQAAFIASFDSIDAFMAWFNNAKAEYDSTDGSVDIGSGSIDLEDIAGGN